MTADLPNGPPAATPDQTGDDVPTVLSVAPDPACADDSDRELPYDALAGSLRTLADDAERSMARLHRLLARAERHDARAGGAAFRLQERLQLGVQMIEALEAEIERAELAAAATECEVSRAETAIRARSDEVLQSVHERFEQMIGAEVARAEHRLAEREAALEAAEDRFAALVEDAVARFEQRATALAAVEVRLRLLEHRADALDIVTGGSTADSASVPGLLAG
jgi:hypothetical protein